MLQSRGGTEGSGSSKSRKRLKSLFVDRLTAETDRSIEWTAEEELEGH